MTTEEKPKKRKRDYQKENEYKKRPEQIAARVLRNAARRLLIREGKVSKGDGTHVNHITYYIEATTPDTVRHIQVQAITTEEAEEKAKIILGEGYFIKSVASFKSEQRS